MVLAVMIIIAVGGQGGFFWQRYELKTKFADVGPEERRGRPRRRRRSRARSPAWSSSGAEVEVTLEVKKEQQPRITDDSRASIGSLSLLGEPVIDISPRSTGTPLKDGDFILRGRAPGQMADVADGARRSRSSRSTALLKDIRAGKGTVGKLFTDDELYYEINAFVASAAEGVAVDTCAMDAGTLGLPDQGSGRLPNG